MMPCLGGDVYLDWDGRKRILAALFGHLPKDFPLVLRVETGKWYMEHGVDGKKGTRE